MYKSNPTSMLSQLEEERKKEKMALMNMYKPEQQCGCLMGPRISFSTDFVVGPSEQYPTASKYERIDTTPDFEFSAATGNKCLTVAAADELFFNGRLMPLKEGNSSEKTMTTLRDELLTVESDEEGHVSRSTPLLKSPVRWKGFLVLKNTGNKACNKYAPKKGSIDDDHWH